jgi:hypothetical protein
MATQPAPRRVFLFGKYREIDQRAIPRGSIGWIDPAFDGLEEAEYEVRQPATRRTVGHGSPGEGE